MTPFLNCFQNVTHLMISTPGKLLEILRPHPDPLNQKLGMGGRHVY